MSSHPPYILSFHHLVITSFPCSIFFYPFHVGKKNAPPKYKTDEDGDLPSEETEKKDPVSFPDMMNMDKPTLKSELNQPRVCIVGNPLKANLQEKLHAAYTDELMDKAAKYYQNYQHCYYAILKKSVKKSSVSF